MFMTTDEIERLIREDVPYIDLTCELLGIRMHMAEIRYATRENGIVAGTEIVAKMFDRLGIELIEMKHSGEQIKAGDVVLIGKGSSEAIHTVWKIGQNIIDYCSGVASTTRKMVDVCNQASPKIALLTTRKSIPGTKHLAIQGIIAGGAMRHRLGLSETILIFQQHRAFFVNDEALMQKIAEIKHLTCEKKIVIEAESLEEALRFAQMGIDAIQFDKLTPEALKEAVGVMKMAHPHISLLGAGGINPSNIQAYCETGVDGLVTTSPYYAKALDIKVMINPLS